MTVRDQERIEAAPTTPTTAMPAERRRFGWIPGSWWRWRPALVRLAMVHGRTE